MLSIYYIQIKLQLGSVKIFVEGKKNREPEEKPLEQSENQQSAWRTYDARSRIETRMSQQWRVSILTTVRLPSVFPTVLFSM